MSIYRFVLLLLACLSLVACIPRGESAEVDVPVTDPPPTPTLELAPSPSLPPTESNQSTLLKAHPLGTIQSFVFNANGEPPNDSIYNAEISDDGRWVAFQSRADNLVSEDTNNSDDVFLLDRETGNIELVSVAPDGSQGVLDVILSGMSADGRYVIFWSFMGNVFPQNFEGNGQVYLRDTILDTTEIVSLSQSGEAGNGSSLFADMTPDARYIVFTSNADNLANDTNTICTSAFTGAEGLNCEDIFLYDRQSRQTELISILPDGTQGNNRVEYAEISADGRWVAYMTTADNFLNPDPNDGACYDPPTDRQVNCADIFLHDRETKDTILVSKSDDGAPGNMGARLTDISADGRYTVYYSESDNLVPNDSNGVADVFMYDRERDTTIRLSVTPDGTEGNGASIGGQMTHDGRFIAFSSHATNFVAEDNNIECTSFSGTERSCEDGFLLELEIKTFTRVSYIPEGETVEVSLDISALTTDTKYILVNSVWNPGDRRYELRLVTKE
jgi:WD40 repeat protein